MRRTGDASLPREPAGGHLPVMLDEVLANLQPRDGGVYLDATFGGGGYASGILDHAECTLWAIDRDPEAIARGEELAQIYRSRCRGGLHMIEGSFGDMLSLLAARGVHSLDGVVMDLGVSSFQLDQAARGFSFRRDGPLDMRMSRHGETAAELVNRLEETELADLIYRFGEERRSRQIARAIVASRRLQPIETTLQLAALIRSAVPPDRSSRIDPATRSFQALRIQVNDELGEIERGLSAAASILAPGGRLVVVSFHSLEDRIVKRFMSELAGKIPAPSRHDPRGFDNDWRLNRSSIEDKGGRLDKSRFVRARFRLLGNRINRPGNSESHINPRARSAKLRALEYVPEIAETNSPAGSLA